jgi:hypothetical protein
MRVVLSLAVVAAVFAARPVFTAPGNVRVTLHDGLVSVEANNAQLREILEAWALVGETAFVNADRATTAPLTLDLIDMPEEEALGVLLRSMGGYLAVPRSDTRTGMSHFARIVILPTSVVDRSSTVRPASEPTVPPALTPAPVMPVNGVTRLIGPNGQQVEDDQQDARPPPAPRGAVPPSEVSPGPGVGAPQQASPTSPSSSVVGSAVPGMIPQQPQGQPPPQR